MPAKVATAVNGKQVDKDVRVGLVGMHIAHKSKSSPQWIWSTFEQVDNLDVDFVAHPKLNPSFFDPGCPTCVPNQENVRARVFDLWSWQAFVSLNWPTDDHGHRLADAKDTSEASPAWTFMQALGY